MNIAVVGAGAKCLALLKTLKNHSFKELKPKIVAVADEREDAVGMKQAREDGIFVTTDYKDLFDMDNLDLIIELTGSEEVFYDILDKKRRNVRAFDHETAQLFWELSRISALQEKTNEELAKTRSLYHVVTNELLEEDVMIISPGYQIIDVNETLAKKLGLEPGDLIGRYCYEVSHNQDTPCEGKAHPCPLVQTLKTRKSSKTTHIHHDSDNKELHYSISCYPIFEGGKIAGVLEISKDITRDINIQKIMMQQEKLASIGQLAAGVAHEINNPMTTILTTAMLMQEDMDPGDPNYGELQTIADETLRCRKIVTSLLNFARQTEPQKKACDVNDIILDAVALTKKQAAFKDVSLNHDLAQNMPPLWVDKDQMQQAFINLALNAIEATDPGGKVTFSSRVLEKDKVVSISVSDTGKGVHEKDLGRIFEPFFTTKENGTGLGMAITHGFVEQNGGTIEVRSKLGKGTTFEIRLHLEDREKDVH
jgi:two-component system NtrC family sensor kinase